MTALPLVALLVAAAALLTAIAALRRLAELADRVDQLSRSTRPTATPTVSRPLATALQERRREQASAVATPPVELAPPPVPEPEPEPEPERAPEPLYTATPIADDEEEIIPEPIEDDPEPEAEAPAARAPLAPTPRPSASESWEDRLGGRVFVWIGGIALVLAGAFLVKYSFDRGILSPGVRLVLGGLVGLGLIAAAQWLHRRSDRVSAAACGAGLADLFAVVLAATTLYGYLGPITGLLLLGLIAAGAVVLSLRHGSMVALLGLLGGYLTPALIGSAAVTQRGMFGYLLALEVGLLIVTRTRRWSGLATLTLVGALGWAGYGIAIGDSPDTRIMLTAFLGLSAAAFILSAWRTPSEQTQGWLNPIRLAFAAGGSALALAAVVAGRGGFTAIDFATFGLLSAAAVVLARLDVRYHRLPWLALPISLLLVGASIAVAVGEEQVKLLFAALGVAGIFGVGGYAAAWGSRRPADWATLSTVAFIGALLLGLLINARWSGEVIGAWWAISAGGALLLACGAAGLLRRREQSDYDQAAQAPAVGAAVFATLSVWLGAAALWMPTGFAALALGSAIVWTAVRLPAVRFAVWWNLLLMGIALLATWYEPVMDPGHWLVNDVWGWLGLPTLLVGALTAWLIRAKRSTWAETTGGLATVLLALLGVLLVRHGFQSGEEMLGHAPGVYEWNAYVLVLQVLALALLAVGPRLPLQMTRPVGLVALGLAGGALLLGPVALTNPMWVAGEYGGVGLAGLLLIYGLPAVLAGVAAWRLLRLGEMHASEAVTGGTLVLLTMLGAAALRLAWHGPVAPAPLPDAWEWTAYALLLAGIGGALLALAPRLPLRTPHVGGLVAIAAALAATALGPAVGLNPLWSPVDVGAMPVFNGLLVLYGLPLLAAVGLAWLLHWRRLPAWRNGAAVTALVLGFVLVSLQIRQGFAGARLDVGGVQQMEWYAYSVAWVLFALGLLAAGWKLRRRPLRYAGLAVMALAIAKVFAIDTAHLEDLYRVLSLMGLGLALLGVAFVYHRVIKPAPAKNA